jgi:hypothetical protein
MLMNIYSTVQKKASVAQEFEIKGLEKNPGSSAKL